MFEEGPHITRQSPIKRREEACIGGGSECAVGHLQDRLRRHQDSLACHGIALAGEAASDVISDQVVDLLRTVAGLTDFRFQHDPSLHQFPEVPIERVCRPVEVFRDSGDPAGRQQPQGLNDLQPYRCAECSPGGRVGDVMQGLSGHVIHFSRFCLFCNKNKNRFEKSFVDSGGRIDGHPIPDLVWADRDVHSGGALALG